MDIRTLIRLSIVPPGGASGALLDRRSMTIKGIRIMIRALARQMRVEQDGRAAPKPESVSGSARAWAKSESDHAQ